MSSSASSPLPTAGFAPERQVLVLDISRSMRGPLPDPTGNQREKIEIARSAVAQIVRHAEMAGSAFGLVTFNDEPQIVLPMGPVGRDGLDEVQRRVAAIAPSGRSAIWDALGLGADLLRDGSGAVHGVIVLVTDGWDNASRRFTIDGSASSPGPTARRELFDHLLPTGSQLRIRIIGIGNGSQKDKGVDSERMHLFLNGLNERALAVGIAAGFSYEEVDTGAQLFDEMVHAFLDVEEEMRPAPSHLPPEEVAADAARAARALKAAPSHSPIARLSRSGDTPSEADAEYSEVPEIGVEVVSASVGAASSLRPRYGPLGDAAEAFLARDYPRASAELERARPLIPTLTYSYWRARIAHGRGDNAEATTCLLEAWRASESVPSASRIRVMRRLALLQARVQKDPEAEALLRFVDRTESHLQAAPPELKDRILDVLERLLELYGTYQLARLGTADPAEAARRHEEAVDGIFGELQDVRLENTTRDPSIDGTLDFIEVFLAEMR